MTILAPVRVGIGIVFSSCWQNLSQNRLELNWYDWNSELSWCMIPIPHIFLMYYNGMVCLWDGIFIFQIQYKVISKQKIASKMSPYCQ